VTGPSDAGRAPGRPAGTPRPGSGSSQLPAHLDPRGGSRGSPAGRPGSAGRSRRMARLLSWVAVLTSVSILATAGAGWALLRHYDGNIARIGGVFDGGGDRPQDVSRDATTFLVVGSDTRGDLAPGEGTQGEGDELVEGERSDTVILAHFFGGTDQAQLVSFPRDSWVTIPEHTDPQTGDFRPAREAKLNEALNDGGPALVVRTVEQLTGVRIDHYVQVDFDGFKTMVDRLGGVEVCLTEPARDRFSGIDLDAGRHHVDGDVALAFVRQRQGTGISGGDLGRIERQQQFLGAMVREVLSAGTLLNPVKLNGFLTAATRSLQVDDGTSAGDLQDLAFRMRGFEAGGVAFATVPVADPDARRGRGQSVVLLDEPAAEQLFDRIRRDVPPGATEEPDGSEEAGSPTQEPLIVQPANVRVRVYNGAGVQGIARRAAQDLEQVGFQLVGAPDNRGTGARQSVVRHGPDRADSARTLAAAVPGAVLELDPALDRTLELVVGSSYAGARPVTVTGGRPAAPAPATATPTAAPQVVTAAEDPCAAA
jgi:LCP family protein required for cell wall assembly